MDSTDALADDVTDDLVTAELDAASAERSAPRKPSAPRPEPAEPATSDVVLRARYVLEAKIGEGGTSVVYRARDLRRDAAAPGGQRVALKLLRPGLRNHPRAVERLKREFHHAQTLSHPHIARVYDVDCDSGAWFLTLELLEGESLAALLQRHEGPVPARRVLDILRACGEALAFAHERAVVHGDFKPGNVFITSSGQVRVLDFGSASASWLPGENHGLTATPAYASPEVLSGQRPERRDDIFSFACVAYEMFTGRHPYARRSALEASSSNLVPERNWSLSSRQWHALESGLAWKREERPASLRSLLGNVTSIEAPLPLVLPDMNVTATPFRSPRLAPFSAFAALAALAAVVFVASWQLDDLPDVVDRTQEVARNLAALPPLATGGAQSAVEASPAALTRSRLQPAAAASAVRAPQARQQQSTAVDGAGSAMSDERASLAPPPRRTYADSRQEPALSPRTAALAAFEGTDEFTDPGSSAFISFDVDAVTVSEGATTAVLRINRRHQLAGRAVVHWRTLAGTARPGADFREVARGVAEFADGQTTRAIYVPLLNDLLIEKDETFTVELFSPGGATRINPIARALVNVRDNDSGIGSHLAQQ